MDQELKAKWVKALRSGEHIQARQCLVDERGALCCLGVLHRVLTGKNPVDIMWDCEKNPKPVEIRNSFGVLTENMLARMNDDGKSFAEIADYIEANL